MSAGGAPRTATSPMCMESVHPGQPTSTAGQRLEAAGRITGRDREEDEGGCGEGAHVAYSDASHAPPPLRFTCDWCKQVVDRTSNLTANSAATARAVSTGPDCSGGVSWHEDVDEIALCCLCFHVPDAGMRDQLGAAPAQGTWAQARLQVLTRANCRSGPYDQRPRNCFT